MATVLIASLGDSPVVVTAMFDLLSQERTIDQLIVFYTSEEISFIGYDDMIYKPLRQRCKVDGVALDANDVGSEEASYEFLRKLYLHLNEYQRNGDSVYLSLAGGRKSMAALMALLAPLFPCVKGLYHILDVDEGKKGHHFWTTRRLYDLPTEEDKHRHLFPSHERVKLISIPYGESQHPNKEVKSLLFNITEEQLEELWERDAEQAKAIKYHRDQGKIISVELTKDVAKQYREMCKFDETHAKNFAICFEQMHFASYLNKHSHDIYSHKHLHFHYYKRHRTVERPVFHTEPIDIKANPEASFKRVVVSALPREIEGSYPALEKIIKKLKFPLETEKLEDILPQEKELILIIPLGTSPMVATQLYQLYTDRGDKVHSVILVHTQHCDVLSSVAIAQDAFKGIGIDCNPIPLKGWGDIDTSKACEAYQILLEKTIQDTREQNPSCQIELTISGGRKGMAALATFAAQNLGIHHVVHTVIHDPITHNINEKTISDRVSEDTTIEELKRLEHTGNKQERDKRLFLRAYEQDNDAFVLFNIPVIPAQKG
jgi:CRISPR-associated Csx14 family protein